MEKTTSLLLQVMEKKGIFTFFLYSFFIFSCLYAKICFQAPLVAFLCRYFDTVSVELHLTGLIILIFGPGWLYLYFARLQISEELLGSHYPCNLHLRVFCKLTVSSVAPRKILPFSGNQTKSRLEQ